MEFNFQCNILLFSFQKIQKYNSILLIVKNIIKYLTKKYHWVSYIYLSTYSKFTKIILVN